MVYSRAFWYNEAFHMKDAVMKDEIAVPAPDEGKDPSTSPEEKPKGPSLAELNYDFSFVMKDKTGKEVARVFDGYEILDKTDRLLMKSSEKDSKENLKTLKTIKAIRNINLAICALQMQINAYFRSLFVLYRQCPDPALRDEINMVYERQYALLKGDVENEDMMKILDVMLLSTDLFEESFEKWTKLPKVEVGPAVPVARLPSEEPQIVRLEEVLQRYTDKIAANMKKTSKEAIDTYLRDPAYAENGFRQRRPGGGAQASWDASHAQMKVLFRLVNAKRFPTLSAAIDYLLRHRELYANAQNPFRYAPGMDAPARKKVRNQVLQRYKTWCKNHKKHAFPKKGMK